MRAAGIRNKKGPIDRTKATLGLDYGGNFELSPRKQTKMYQSIEVVNQRNKLDNAVDVLANGRQSTVVGGRSQKYEPLH